MVPTYLLDRYICITIDGSTGFRKMSEAVIKCLRQVLAICRNRTGEPANYSIQTKNIKSVAVLIIRRRRQLHTKARRTHPNKAYKFRLYPNKEQVVMFTKTFRSERFIYNRMPADKIAHREKTSEFGSRSRYQPSLC